MNQENLKQELSYDPTTGVFMWIKPKKGRKRNKPAGTHTPDGYTKITIDGFMWPAHRLAWIYVYGEIPESMVIDHVNGDTSDNRICNLRIATRAQNNQNRRMTKKNGGLIGISYDKRRGKYLAQIVKNGKHAFLGYFDSADEAHAAYVKAKRELHEFCTI